MKYPVQQVWFCEECQQVGATELSPSIDITRAITALGTAHRHVAPTCQNGAWGLRVINPEVVTSKATLIADESIPRWAIDQLALKLGFQEPPQAATEGKTEEALDRRGTCERCNTQTERQGLTQVSIESQGHQKISL